MKESHVSIFKKPWFYIVLAFLVLTTILLGIYVIPHKLTSVIPARNIEYVVLYPDSEFERRIDDDKLEQFIELLKDAKVTTYPKWGKDMRWGYNTSVAVHYKNGTVIKFGEHRWYKDNTYGNFKVNTFDFDAVLDINN